jgi:ribosomal protein S18 acetylase RimI-like enzyme
VSGAPVIRLATRDDLPAVVRLLADDKLGTAREDPSDPPNEKYVAAFDAIAADADNDLVVMEQGGTCVGCLQITIFPGFDRLGAQRAWIECVRVASHLRGQGFGRDLVLWAVEHARHKGCEFAQLAVNKDRAGAIRFYKSLGFVAEHEGMKLTL